MAYKSPQDAEQDEREAAQGRITLDEAARRIGESGEDREDAVQAKLEQAVLAGDLPVYAPGATGRYLNLRKEDGRSNVRTFYLRCYIEDLDKWLENNETRIKYRFSSSPPPRTSPLPEWAPEARRIALEYLSQTRDYQPTTLDAAKHVEREFREARQTNTRGDPITADYIRRFALAGVIDEAARLREEARDVGEQEKNRKE